MHYTKMQDAYSVLCLSVLRMPHQTTKASKRPSPDILIINIQ